MTAEKSEEFRGKTVEQATAIGLTALGMSRDEVAIEVVRPGSRGVLGIGAEDAIVRIVPLRVARAEAAPAPRSAPEPTRAAPPAPKPVASATEPAPTPQAQPKAEGKQAQARPQPKPEAAKGSRSVSAARAGEDDRATEALQMGSEFLAGMLERMGLQADVEITQQSDAESDDDERVQVLNIVGDDLGVLIGRQNEVLSALEFITRLAVNQRSRSRSSFVLDVNGYRARRAESLRKLAFRTAEQVVQVGRTMTLEPMPPAERRIIHLALRDHPKVYTQSVGEGDRRKVTVILKRDA
ncbi:MAG: KH domain-containing protein [Chloroflexi bacterium]|nr:KH domain-containing protein [Chloroflexota bacterium]